MKLKNSRLRKSLVATILSLSLFIIPVSATEGADTIDITLTARYDVDINSPEGGLEIVTYNPANKMAYAVDGINSVLIAVPLSDIGNAAFTDLSSKGFQIDLKTEAEKANSNFIYGDITSVAVSKDNTKLAVALQAKSHTSQGLVAVFPIDKSEDTLGSPTYFQVGIQPDMVTFSDNNTILSADEGEPRMGYGVNSAGETVIDPKGSISIINIKLNTVKINYFDSFDKSKESLVTSGVLMSKGSLPSVDFEPEYIVVTDDGSTAYVGLQENNSIAVVDIEISEITSILPLGFKDFSLPTNAIYLDGASQTYENLLGAYMPDGISIYEANGKTYILTANEGDGREWSSTVFPADHDDAGDPNDEDSSYYSNEVKVTLTKGEKEISKVVVIDPSVVDGLPKDKTVIFGARSLSIFEVINNSLKLVYDSGSNMEDVTSKLYPEWFNTSSTSLKLNDRSKKKGPEPENVTVGTVDGQTFAFVVLERISGIVAYNISSMDNISFSNYVNTRDFSAEDGIGGDSAPEGIHFISAADSATNKALLIAGCEVTGTMPVYSLMLSTKDVVTSETTTTVVEEKVATTHVVISGDTLYKISKALLGDGNRYMEIYELNKSFLKNPNLIYVGQTLEIPSK